MINFKPEWVGVRSDVGPVRTNNEDAYWVTHAETPSDLGALYLVADGVGGQEAGDVAAQTAADIISTAFYSYRQGGEPTPAALKRAILQANQTIFQQAQARGGIKMGCTLVAAVIDSGYLLVAHVGDARAYVLTGGRLQRLTRDDTWVQKQVEAGVITAEQAARHELRNVVTQVLGNKEEIEVHLTQSRELFSNDMILLCSDGLHDPLDGDQIGRIMRGKAAQSAANDLVQAAIDGETHDNVTAVVVNVGEIPGKVRGEMAAPAGGGRAKVPLWVVATLVVGVLIAAASLFAWWQNGQQPNGAPPPVDVNQSEAEPNPTDSVPALQEAPSATPAATSTLAPTQEPTPTPLPTATATATATPLPQALGCIVNPVFIWDDAAILGESCSAVANERFETGEQVLILSDEPRSLVGPSSSDCEQGILNVFIEVESVTDPEKRGWVLSNLVRPVAPDEACVTEP